jgi:hypothetical protein
MWRFLLHVATSAFFLATAMASMASQWPVETLHLCGYLGWMTRKIRVKLTSIENIKDSKLSSRFKGRVFGKRLYYSTTEKSKQWTINVRNYNIKSSFTGSSCYLPDKFSKGQIFLSPFKNLFPLLETYSVATKIAPEIITKLFLFLDTNANGLKAILHRQNCPLQNPYIYTNPI